MSPARARKICGAVNCPKLAESGARYCDDHRREKQWRGSDPKRTGTAAHRNRQARIFADAGYRCEIRWDGCTFTAEILDHIIALGLGGADTDANTQAACRKCSGTKASIEAHIASGHAVEMPPMRRHGVKAAAVPPPKAKPVSIPRRIETIP